MGEDQDGYSEGPTEGTQPFEEREDTGQVGESTESSLRMWPKPPDVGGSINEVGDVDDTENVDEEEEEGEDYDDDDDDDVVVEGEEENVVEGESEGEKEGDADEEIEEEIEEEQEPSEESMDNKREPMAAPVAGSGYSSSPRDNRPVEVREIHRETNREVFDTAEIQKKNITEMNPEKRINNPNYLNWIKGTLALMHMCDVVRNYAYHIFDKFLDTISDRSHYNCGSNYKFLAYHAKWDSSQWKFTTTYQCVCHTLFQEILRLHSLDDKRIGFTNCKAKTVGGPWGLAKFFMPESRHCADIETPGETEPISVLKMIQNCRLFDHIAPENIKIIIESRNAMMNSPLNNINDADLEKYIDAMVDFLKDAMNSQIKSDIRQQLDKAQKEIRELRYANMRVCFEKMQRER
ncbi:uncharacterized protein LOC132743989 isoform X2 [Ruditapes philippinarum]|uniref:uncharacterized protein LOC132743989 isoform X2 n=1 Tax=Ruditapes philippinarum TaxID=129788 RepID=UPI00295B0A55|nr:uncharacterized protein LOC132743989 isoform X2 [Ruditapes philippinarum]